MEGELAVCCSEAEPEQLRLPVLIPGASGINPGPYDSPDKEILPDH